MVLDKSASIPLVLVPAFKARNYGHDKQIVCYIISIGAADIYIEVRTAGVGLVLGAAGIVLVLPGPNIARAFTYYQVIFFLLRSMQYSSIRQNIVVNMSETYDRNVSMIFS